MPPDQQPAERRLIYFLVCEQSRTEISRKNMFIGVYGGCLISEGPFPVFLPSLTVVGCIRPKEYGEKVTVTIEVPGMEKAIEPHVMELKAEHPLDTVTFNYTFSPAVLPQEGTLRVTFLFSDGHTEFGTLELVSRDAYDALKKQKKK